MKKTLALILATALILTVFAGCNSNSIKQALSGKEPESIASDAEGSSTELLGGWVKAESPEITEELQALFDKGLDDLVGVGYMPVAYLGSQVVAGTNHCFLAQATLVYPGAEPTYVLIYLYKNFQGEVEIMNIADFDFGAFCTYGA